MIAVLLILSPSMLKSSIPSLIQCLSSLVETIFEMADMHDLYLTKMFCPLEQLKDNLVTEYQSKWLVQCNSMPKLRTYVKFKSSYCTETYVKIYMLRSQRSIIAQLRSGILPLRIETGRFQNKKDALSKQVRKLKAEERVCLICKTNDIEDELHFIFECKEYCEFRNEMYDKVLVKKENFMNLSNIEKLNYLMKDECKILSEYLVNSWNKRRTLMIK